MNWSCQRENLELDQANGKKPGTGSCQRKNLELHPDMGKYGTGAASGKTWNWILPAVKDYWILTSGKRSNRNLQAGKDLTGSCQQEKTRSCQREKDGTGYCQRENMELDPVKGKTWNYCTSCQRENLKLDFAIKKNWNCRIMTKGKLGTGSCLPARKLGTGSCQGENLELDPVSQQENLELYPAKGKNGKCIFLGRNIKLNISIIPGSIPVNL